MRPIDAAPPSCLRRSPALLLAFLTTGMGIAPVPQAGAQLPSFTDATVSSGLGGFLHANDDIASPIEPRWIASGAAAGDIDGDGDLDLYLVGGDLFVNRLYRNDGGSFTDIAAAAGVAIAGVVGSSPVFADVEGDGDLDLFVFSVQGAPPIPTDPPIVDPGALPRLFLNDGSGQFTDASAASGLASYAPVYSAALADTDRDGDLDLFLAHWIQDGPMLWENQGGGAFVHASATALGPDTRALLPNTFTPIFADLDADGWPDLLVASDFGQSRHFANRGGRFERRNATVLTDENGMGAAVGDVDNDGDLDWFVSSIWDPDGIPEAGWGVTGNRLYRNDGNGTLTEFTTATGVREGFWGWGACFADFDLDGDLDLFHTNGFPAGPASEFHADPSRLFLNDGSGLFSESSAAAGIVDTGQGRGVVCFDFDDDGDLDILVVQNGNLSNGYAAPVRLLRATPPAGRHWLKVQPAGRGANTEAVGARVSVRTGDLTQLRELRLGSNFASQDPVEAHFGLGPATDAEEVRVIWPDGTEVTWEGVAGDQRFQPTLATACTCNPSVAQANAGEVSWSVACESAGAPLVGLPLAFSVISGPNAGLAGNATTGATGIATLGFAGVGSAAHDQVRVTASAGGLGLACRVEVLWLPLFADGFESGDTSQWP